jgi:hypothetical protein
MKQWTKKFVLLTILSFLSSGTSSCGSKDTIDDSDVNEEKLHGRYEAHFDANTSKLTFYVQLRLGGSTGTTVRLSDQSRLKVGDDTMAVVDGDEIPLNFSGTYYRLEYSTSVIQPQYSIKWTRTTGETFENLIRIPAAVSLSSPSAGFAHTTGTSFPFAAASEPLNANDSLTCVLSSLSEPQPQQQKSVSISCPVDGTGTIVGTDVAKLPLGPATAHTLRQSPTTTPLGHDAEGGIVRSSYKSLMVSGSIAAAN